MLIGVDLSEDYLAVVLKPHLVLPIHSPMIAVLWMIAGLTTGELFNRLFEASMVAAEPDPSRAWELGCEPIPPFFARLGRSFGVGA